MPALPRLFVAAERFVLHEPLSLHGPEHHYLSRVLRLGIGAEVLLLDGSARVATTRIASITAQTLKLEWLSITDARGAGEPEVTLYMGLCKGEKQDLIIQKATELGASRLVSVVCKHSVPELDEDRAERRLTRWQRIARAAAQQCRRPDLLDVEGPLPLTAALQKESEREALRLMLYEGTAPPLRSVIDVEPRPARVSLIVGPEGGLAPSEIDALQAAGFLPVSLGPRVLRAETAAIAALSVVLTG